LELNLLEEKSEKKKKSLDQGKKGKNYMKKKQHQRRIVQK